jgi:hypothetical protein
VPSLGGGIAAFTSQRAPFPGFIGVSSLSLDVSYERERFGAFVRGGSMSSGDDGRWTALVGILGGSYRLGGDGETTFGFVARGGLLYQRWHAEMGGCPIPLFIPSNCTGYANPPVGAGGAFVPPPPNYATTLDTGGLVAGMRMELPSTAVFAALGAEVGSTVDFTSASPGVIFTGQLTFSLAFRNHTTMERRAPRPGRWNQTL